MFLLRDIEFKNVLHIANLHLKAGKITCLFGPSGCGKTTTLRLLNGMQSPDSGEILFKGVNLLQTDLIKLRRNVIMLPQTGVLYPGSVRDNLNIGAYFQDSEDFTDDKLREALSQVELSSKKPEEDPLLFSGGEKQRLTLARVLLLKPEALLLDEPTSALDDKTEVALMDLVSKICTASSTTCILVTHSERIAKMYSHEIVYMEHGRILHIEAGGLEL